ncbi:MAG: histidine kinase [Polaribacter sp.]|uniref:sensor histidine kinase n=1 Tax=Polaribacter sp. TaxID=1920175 RepID=UPI002F350117
MKTKVIITTLIKLILHSFFWIGVYFFYTYFLGYGSDNIAYVNKFSAFLMPVTIIMSYFFLYQLIPKYLIAKKHGLFVLYTIYTFIISFCFIMISIFYGLVFSTELTIENSRPLTKTIFFIALGIYIVVLVVITIGLVIHSYKNIVNNEDLKNKFLQTQLELKEQELKFLKMQIHPHFLFNSLNTIYGFAIAKADEAPEMILKLSNLLDYILYQVEKPKVLLIEEINHLEDYISLERMRFHDTLKVDFSKERLNDSLQIPPMLLIPFVENSFKHGEIKDGVLNVNIRLKTENNCLFFEVENTATKKEKKNVGIGLQNIKKRLEMLYSKKHQLEIIEKNDTFKVHLKIEF